MWFAVLKDADFEFDTEQPHIGGHFDSDTKETMINLAAAGYKYLKEDEIIDKIINTISHESGHKAFDASSNEEVKEIIQKISTLFKEAFGFHLQEVTNIVYGQDRKFLGVQDDRLTELKDAIDARVELFLIDEIFAQIAGKAGNKSRILMETYHLDIGEYVHDELTGLLELYSKGWEENVSIKKLPNSNLILNQVNMRMRILINALSDYATKKTETYLVKEVVNEMKLDTKDMDLHQKMIKFLYIEGKEDILQEYLETGNLDKIKNFLQNNNKWVRFVRE